VGGFWNRNDPFGGGCSSVPDHHHRDGL